jgi:hypothetical protein
MVKGYIALKKKSDKDFETPNWGKKEDSDGGGGCFIATATMGDYNHPTVLQLRFFRDAYLLQRKWGQIFTRLYYKWGPYLANIIKKSDMLKKLSYFSIVRPLAFIASKLNNRK